VLSRRMRSFAAPTPLPPAPCQSVTGAECIALSGSERPHAFIILVHAEPASEPTIDSLGRAGLAILCS
jgi:hypothetical protein